MDNDTPAEGDRAAASQTGTSRNPNLALSALFLAAFVVGSAELLVVGVLTLVADDLSVSEQTAGLLVTSYALGIAVGGPLLSSVTIGLPRRALLRVAFAAYIAGNLLASFSGSFALLVVARAVTGSLHGLFVGTALGIAASLVPPARMGQAISLVLGGIAVSTAFGVPLGTLIGQSFGWRASFLSIFVLGLVALVGIVVLVPRTEKAGAGELASQAHSALAPRVLLVLLTGFLVMGGQFAALTYLTPFLQQVTGLSGGSITIFLMIYGIATAIGTLVGGRVADRNANLGLVVGTIVVVVSLGAMYLVGSSPVLVGVCLVFWGMAGFGLVPSLQYRTVTLAGDGRDLAATLPASATTGGIALGSVLGGWALSSFGPASPVLVAAIACVVVLPLAYATTFLKAPPEEPGARPEESADGSAGDRERSTAEQQ
jgi:DHA1 family inner membrane transport protein